MLSISRKILLVVLVLLQFIAPLVHAHAGTKLSGFGLHLPGLETYDQGNSIAVLSAVNADLHPDGLTVCVNNGIIPHDQGGDQLDLLDCFYFDEALRLVNRRRPLLKVNFSPQSFWFKNHYFSLSHSPRAPPPSV